MKIPGAFVIALLIAASPAWANKVTLDENGVMEIDGKKTFVFSFSIPPPPGGKTPEGGDAFAELRDAGVNFMRIRPTTGPEKFAEADIRTIGAWLDAAAAQQMHCWVTLGHLPSLPADKPKLAAEHERLLRLAIELYKDHPGLGAWKGYDEPAWVKMPADPLVNSYRLFKKLDPNHPVIIIQAPMKASLPLEGYVDAGDIFGVDIYPITYPPGTHSDLPNNEISLVADWTQIIRSASKGKPIWMTLQIAWAGTATPGKTLRFPTFPQQRYMAYAAIINGARGINFQGGERPLSLTERDLKLGWNWTYWKKVMRPLAEELGEKSPLYPALIAADAKRAVKVEGAGGADVEVLAREVRDELFILAARREGATSTVKFTGLPEGDYAAGVTFEEPRTVRVSDGAMEDWFAPHDVHVYRMRRQSPK
jgi:hypothetical protein